MSKKSRNNRKKSNVKKTAFNKRNGFSDLLGWTGNHLWMVAIALFVFSFTIRLLISFWTGPMLETTYPDEIRFFDIARSLAQQGQFLVRGLPTTFQKILYPLFIAPAFLLTDDQIVQVNIIRVINCLLVSSTVFPVLLLAKKLTSNKNVTLISLLFTVTLPDMAYSATFLSEVLYMPLVVWLFYFAYCAMAEQRQSKRLVYASILGLAIYLVYLTKEIGAAFMIAVVMVFAVDTIRHRQNMVQNALSAFTLSAAFFVLFLAMKLTLFQGMGNTYNTEVYNQVNLSALSSPTVFFYLIYSAFVLFIATLLSFYAAPVFLTLHGFDAMKEENKRIYLFSAFSLVIMVGAIAYTISIREDMGELVPRLHMRYIAPLVIPLMILCLDYLLSDSNVKHGKIFSKAFPIIIIIFGIVSIILIPYASESGYLLDHYTLKSAYTSESFMIHVGTVPINMVFTLFKLFLVALTACGAYLVVKKKKYKPVIVMLLCSVLFINTIDNFMSYTSIRRLKTSDFSMVDFIDPSASHLELAFSEEGKRFSYDLVENVISMNEFIHDLDGTVIVFIHKEYAPFTDTYLDSRAFPVQAGELYRLAMENGGWVRMDAQTIYEGNRHNSGVLDLDTWKRGIFTADHIITLSDDHPFQNVKTVYERWPFVILQNLDPAIVHIEL